MQDEKGANRHQLKIILWKNFVIRKRHWLLTICEALIPVILFLFISYGRSQITEFSKKTVTNVTYNDKYPITNDNVGFNLAETMFFYTPSDPYFSDIVHRVQEKFQIINNQIIGFPNEKELVKTYLDGKASTVVAIIFKSKPGDRHLDYTIRLHELLVNWKTNRLFENVYSFQPGRGSPYSWKGFLTLQSALDLSFLQKEAELNKKHLPEIVLESQEFPYPPYRTDLGFANVLSEFLPLITLFSFSFVCPAVLQRVVEEKYTGVKELMKMVGMKSWALWLGWLIYSIVPMLLSVTLIVVLLKVDIFKAGYPPIEFTSTTILAVFLILYCLTITIHTFFLSTFFEKPTLATLVGFLFWILSYFVPRYLSEDVSNLPFGWCLILMLCPNMALHFGFCVIAQYEIREIGLQWSNWLQPGGGSYNNMAMCYVLIMLVGDCILYALFTLIIDPWNPGKYGISKPIWQRFRTEKVKHMKLKTNQMNEYDSVENGENRELLNFTEPPNKPIISVRNLCKSYENQCVVNNVSMDIHKDSITVLLGHNGAGKSTVMAMITGMLNKTAGKICMNGEEVESVSDYSDSVGLCPQHNMFFSDLTVWEHLKFFALLKGQNCQQAEKDIKKLLSKLKLTDKKDQFPHSLSGGMQRKLCLGMAIIGDSEILILDEPSAGMDIQARNDMRNLLLELRKDRTILISTHFMEEVDNLADRVIMLNDGQTVFDGSNTLIELKQRYGQKKCLRLLLNKEAKIDKLPQEIEETVKDVIDEVILENIDGNQLTYQVKAKDFAKLLTFLDERKDILQIDEVSLSNSSIEDIFEQFQKDQKPELTRNIQISNESIAKSSSVNFQAKLKGLWGKRLNFLKTKWQFHVISAIFAGLFLLLSIVLGQAQVYFNCKGPELNLSVNTYSNTTVLCGGSNSSSLCQIVFEDLVKRKLANVQLEDDLLASIVEAGTKNLPLYQRRMIASSEFTKSDKYSIEATFLYNGLALHSAPISLNLLTNAIAKLILGKDYGISASIHPFQSVVSTTEPLSSTQIGLLWLIILPLGFLFFLGSFIHFPHKEISTNFIKLQFITGMKSWFYWIFTFIPDYMIYAVAVTCLSFLILLWTPFRGFNEWLTFYAILLLYGVNGIPFCYLFSRRKSFSGSYALFVILGVMIGTLLTTIVIALEETKHNFVQIFKLIFASLSPQFGVTYWGVKFARKAVENYNINAMDNIRMHSMCMTDKPNPCCFGETEACAAEKNYFADLKILSLCSLIGCFLCLMINVLYDNYKTNIMWHRLCSLFHSRTKNRTTQVEEVVKTPMENNTLCINKLQKYYGEKEPVVDIDILNLTKGECVGILGINGAGKSTLFRMLTRQEVYDEGSIQIMKDIENKQKIIDIGDDQYLQSIGYCPQDDALNYSLTGKAILTAVAKLRGVGETEVAKILNLFGLARIADKPCGHYSGGNKRKLSFALAIIGLPDFILLDEPTNGIDPLAKRKLWALIRDIKNNQNVSFILTSHSMAECEALCNKLVILKEGKVEGNDTILKLKRTLGSFLVTFQFKEDRVNVESMNNLHTDIQKILGKENIIITDEHKARLTLEVKPNFKTSENALVILYQNCDTLKNRYMFIDDYVIDNGSLEHVLLNVVNHFSP